MTNRQTVAIMAAILFDKVVTNRNSPMTEVKEESEEHCKRVVDLAEKLFLEANNRNTY